MSHLHEITAKLSRIISSNVKEGDDIVVIATNDVDSDAHNALLSTLSAIKNTETVSVFITPRKWFGQPPPSSVIRMVEDADLVIAATSTSLAPTDVLRKTVQSGGRWLNFSGLSLEMLSKPTVTVDPELLKKNCVKLAKALHGNSVHITSKNGTDLRLKILGRKAFPSYHVAEAESYFQAPIPGGEAMIAVVEDSTDGVAVIEKSLSGVKNLKGQVTLSFKDGYLTDIVGGIGADKLRNILESADENAKVLGEVGLGANPKAEIVGNISEDKRVLGTAHIALGDNLFIVPELYGKNSSNAHIDCLIVDPTVTIDGKTIIENGHQCI